MIIKIVSYVDVEGNLAEPKIVSEIISRELSNMLSAEKPKLKTSVLKEIKEANPDFVKSTFISHKEVLEKLRKGV